MLLFILKYAFHHYGHAQILNVIRFCVVNVRANEYSKFDELKCLETAKDEGHHVHTFVF